MATTKNTRHTSRPSAVIACTCTYASHGIAAKNQDAIHGNGQRAHNPSADGYRCTVCQRVKSYQD